MEEVYTALAPVEHRLNRKFIETISDRLTGLPYTDEDDEDARRFDLLVLKLQLAKAEGASGQDQYRKTIVDLAHALEEKKAIPAVATEMPLILEIQSDGYWQHVTLPTLEQLRRSLRGLIKFCDPSGPRQTVYTDFQDEVREDGAVYELVRADDNLHDYRRKVERFIRNNQNHVTIRRLKNNEPITFKDLQALEAILFSEEGPISREQFVKAYGNEGPLGHFIRRIVGLDRKAAKDAFAAFLSASPLSADQISFVDTVINHLVKNGVMEPKTLFDPPFTDLHFEGVAGVFPKRAKEFVDLIQVINKNSDAA